MPQEPEFDQIVWEHKKRLGEDLRAVFPNYEEHEDQLEEKLNKEMEWLIDRINKENESAGSWKE